MHHGAALRIAPGQVVVQRLRQQDGRAGVAARVALHERVAEAGGVVVLEEGGAVHNRVDGTKARRHARQQGAGGLLIGEVGLEQRGVARARGAVGHGLLGLGARAAVVHRHLPAARRERQRDLAAQPAARARDEDGAAAIGEEGGMALIRRRKTEDRKRTMAP